VRATSANKIPPATGGFTLLEIIIALTLVAILVTTSLPYLFDSFAASAGDRAMESITNQAQETRRQAIEKGESRRLKVTSGGLEGVALPAGWSLEMKGLNDSKFHPPLRDQVWEFSSEGICQPLMIRLINGDRQIITTYDALTAQPIHDED